MDRHSFSLLLPEEAAKKGRTWERKGRRGREKNVALCVPFTSPFGRHCGRVKTLAPAGDLGDEDRSAHKIVLFFLE